MEYGEHEEDAKHRRYGRNIMIEIYYDGIEKLNDEELINKVVDTVLETEKIKAKLDVSITFTSNNKIKKINNKYRNIDKETDVLSFPMFEREEIEKLKEESGIQDILGDIIISVEKVQAQAKEYGHSFKRELAYLITHGMLHLLGYDHMIEKEKAEMRKKEEEILGVLDIKRE